METLDPRRKWLALYVVCTGVLMLVVDTTIVNVALPSIKQDLQFTEASLVWVVNAYMVTFGGFLLLGGRLGDLFGQRKLFLLGLTVFTVASLACGLAQSPTVLVVARAVQGLGGAVFMAVALSVIMMMFTEPAERAKAMGVYGFVCAAGGSVGVLLGGVLVTLLDWHWIFLVNIPVGIGVYAASLSLLPRGQGAAHGQKLDVSGAITVTLALMCAIYGVVNHTTWMIIAGAVLLAVFIAIEARSSNPLMPLRLFKLRNVSTANVAGMLWSASMFACFFLSALYMQGTLHYSAMQVGLAYLPTNLIMAAFSLGLSAKIVMKFGAKRALTVGLLLVAVGLALFARAPDDGTYWRDIFPGFALMGVGAGMALNPMILVAMSDVNPSESGLASGVVNTSFMMGGALGLAVLASIASSAGYGASFFVGAGFALVATLLCAAMLVTPRTEESRPVTAADGAGKLTE
jgi:EmrB/QacA subfamily drug resistance transporter